MFRPSQLQTKGVEENGAGNGRPDCQVLVFTNTQTLCVSDTHTPDHMTPN